MFNLNFFLINLMNDRSSHIKPLDTLLIIFTTDHHKFYDMGCLLSVQFVLTIFVIKKRNHISITFFYNVMEPHHVCILYYLYIMTCGRPTSRPYTFLNLKKKSILIQLKKNKQEQMGICLVQNFIPNHFIFLKENERK